MKHDLNLAYDCISLESQVAGISQLTENASRMLQGYLMGIKGFLSDVTQPLTQGLKFDLQPNRRLATALERSNYISMSVISVYVPPGMSVRWLEFLDIMDKAQDIIDDLEKDILKPATVFFSEMLGNPEAITTVSRKRSLEILNGRPADIQKIKTDISHCYNPHNSIDERPYGDVFRRNADWAEANKRIQELSIRLAKTPPGDVVKIVDNLSSIMEKLVIRMKQNPDLYKANGITGGELAEVSRLVGEEVEFYAAHVYTVQTAVKAMADTNTKLNNVMVP